jgi:alkylmercury lyase
MTWWEHQREELPGFELIPHVVHLLAEGKPLSLERLAAESSWTLQDVEAAVRRHPGVDWDDRGRLLGIGLTLCQTPHRFTFDGRTVFGWCASDVLIFPVMLGKSGIIESPCPVTGQQIKVVVTPEQVQNVAPSSAVVSLVRPDKINDIRAEACALGNFFASSAAAGEWLAAHPEGMVHSVDEDFKLHREVMEKLGWARF